MEKESKNMIRQKWKESSQDDKKYLRDRKKN